MQTEQIELTKPQPDRTDPSGYLVCERKEIYALLMFSAGMMGAYTYNLRGGVFCNAQTANVVLMSIALGRGNLQEGLYYLIPISAYCLGAFLSEALPSPVKRLGFLRWDTYLIAFEMIVLFLVGLIPLSVPHHVVQVMINFIASMQYNTFRQMEGIPMATTFCTNHIRQVGIALAKAIRKRDKKAAKRGLVHVGMILCFFLGGTILTIACLYLAGKAIWIALIPTGIVLARLIYADLVVEHDQLWQKPSGH
ncbi:MAG TPA: DUF1275 domain-containing protein [Candidatus Eisenbergiella merdipullorum]|uniref:DUF1275 domain-containing protein n=1 Tax=Candidatus Eisenbergiella merdipullorum TaxID=2838553 RepID=A0A9D2I6B1_9FIRM|nr:DUF1275 domain-containing protein [Candidatus Eisenbergiella merdipullorum]